jgi:hypothetical protein
MRVGRSRIELEIFPDKTEELREILPSWYSTHGKSAAGLYVHPTKECGVEERNNGSHMVVALKSTLLKDPLSLVATAAHELDPVILLGGGLMERDTPDHEPMTDLLTVYLGFGILHRQLCRAIQAVPGREADWVVDAEAGVPARRSLRLCLGDVCRRTRGRQSRMDETSCNECSRLLQALTSLAEEERTTRPTLIRRNSVPLCCYAFRALTRITVTSSRSPVPLVNFRTSASSPSGVTSGDCICARKRSAPYSSPESISASVIPSE